MIPKDPYYIRLSGRGGQGILLAGVLVAEAGMHDGLQVVQTQSYGPEARLGASKSEVILCREEIAHPEVILPDLLLCLSRDAYLRYGPYLAEDGVRVVDERLLREVEVEETIALPIMESARAVGEVLVANVIALGALVALTGMVSEESLRRAIRDRVKPAFRELNEQALDAGLKLGAQVRRRTRVS